MRPYEGRRSGGRYGESGFPANQDHQQAPVADLRETDDLLPHRNFGRCGHPGYPDRHRRQKRGRLSAAAGQWQAVRAQPHRLHLPGGAGGTGSRLFPLTKITNKHLLPIYEKPMIYYPIQTLVDAGIRDILVVTGGQNSGDFLRLLANGKQFGLSHIDYTYQEGEGGIADALALAEHFADGQKLCVILGDNIIETSIRKAAGDFRQQAQGAKILLKEVPDAERFGVADIAGDRIV